MAINVRKPTGRRSISSMLAAPFELWLRLRVRWRHNPGFVAAAAAGSIGLLLALVIAIQGGMRLLDDTSADGEPIEEETYAALGPAALFEADDDMRDPFAESGTRRPALRKHVMDEDFADAVVEEIGPAQPRHPLADDDGSADEDPRGPHPLDEHPLAAEPSRPRRYPRKSTIVEDEPGESDSHIVDADDVDATDEADAEPARDRVKGPNLDIHRVVGSEWRDESEDTPEDIESDSIRPAANVAETAPAGWKKQPQSDQTTEPTPPLVQKSQSVATVVVATPDRKAPAPAQSPSRRGGTRPRFNIEISGPGAVSVGQSCRFEIRVTNTGSAAAGNLTLSVELPDQVVHPTGQSLEQHIVTLAPGQVYRALVRAQVEAPGTAVVNVDVAADGSIIAHASRSVVIGPASTASARLPDCDCRPVSPVR